MDNIRATSSGDWSKTKQFLKRMIKWDPYMDLHKWGQVGVRALESATPVNTGELRRSWGYRIIKTSTGYGLEWYNTNIEDNVPIAIILQYGHGTGTGGYVQGVDYINPAIRPIFDHIADELWKKVIT